MKNILGFYFKERLKEERPVSWDNIDFKQLTHVVWAFFLPDVEGNIVSTDPELDDRELPKIVEAAHSDGCKVLLAVGGWLGSKEFPELASKKETRENFAQNCRDLVEKYNLDGIDIDWEFPGYEPHNGSPADKENLTLLLQAIRDKLDDYKPGLVLTMDFCALPAMTEYLELPKIAEILDFLSIMTYDLSSPHGNQDHDAWHNSALYSDGKPSNHSIDRTMQHFVEEGVPPEKLNIGLAFYGHTFMGCKGVNQPYEGAGGDTSEGAYSYAQIVEMDRSGELVKSWDDIAKVPMAQRDQDEYITYDNERSIQIKTEYVKKSNFAGVLIWELTNDYIDGEHPLLRVVGSQLR